MLITYTQKAILPVSALETAIGIDATGVTVTESLRTITVDLKEIKPAAKAGRMDEAFVLDALDAYMSQRGFVRTDPAPSPRPPAAPPQPAAPALVEEKPKKKDVYSRTIIEAAEVLKK